MARNAAALGWLAFSLASLAASVVWAQEARTKGADRGEFLARAIEAYESAQGESNRTLRLAEFARAEQLFARVSEAAASPELLTNLGNAALQAEHLGAAVLAYRRALALDPSHARAERNLGHARGRLPAWVPRPAPAGASDRLFFWIRDTSASDRSWAAAVAFALASTLFAAGLALNRPVLRTLALAPGLAWLALLASLWMEADLDAGSAAVVLAAEATARTSDSAFSPNALAEPLPAGTELSILEEREGWARIRLANGRDAWLRGSALARVTLAE